MKTILLFLFTLPVSAQTFTHTAPVGPVAVSGMHRIPLPPDVLGRLTDGLGDLRLAGPGPYDVPYRLLRQAGRDGTAFVAFDLVEKTSAPGRATTMVVRRGGGQPIASVSVEVKNTSVVKAATLSGSNDRQTWYALDNTIRLSRHGDSRQGSATTTVQTIAFPPVDYTYLRLVISDSASAPLNILRIGSYGQAGTPAQYTPIPGLTFTRRDSSDRHTYLRLHRPTPARLDRLTIRVGADAPFRRQAELGRLVMETVRRKRGGRGVGRPVFEPLIEGTLSSAGDTTLLLPGLLTTNLCLRIANDDNPPLTITGVDAAQVTTYLIASLRADSTYRLRFGNPAIAAPVYDLSAFANLVPGTLPVAAVGLVADPATAITSNDSRPNRRQLLWGTLTLVLILLGAMTYSMLQNVSKRRQNTPD